MKPYSLYIILSLILITLNANASLPALRGRVTEAGTQLPLAGATISIPDLRISQVADQNGEYLFSTLPTKGRFLIEVKFVGYKSLVKSIDITQAASVNFSLEKSVIEVQEVVVTGTANSSMNRKNSTSVAVIKKEDLIRVPATNIVDAISRIPGVSQITTGSAISKPVIRGLSYNRVITLSDGVKQEGQQWGDEHGIEIDQYRAERVEILRGAASLLYGSDAMGGVVNIIDPLPPSPGQIRGELLSSYATNNGLSGSSAMLEGNSNGFVWRGRGSYKNAYGYNTPDYRLPNTGFKETNLSGLLGFNKSWGYTHLDLSSFQQKLGMPDFELENGQFIVREEGSDDFTIIDPSLYKTRNLITPFQNVRHYKAALNTYLLLGEGKLRAVMAYQNSQRREFEDNETDPNLFFDLKTYSYDFKYYFKESKGWEPSIGVSGAFQNNRNKAPELLVPDYDSRDLGAFVYAKKNWTNTTFNAGLRIDYRNIDGRRMEEEGDQKFPAFSNQFSNLSGAIGITHEFNERLSFKANMGSAFRAPNVAELGSNGVHEGTLRYEKGNANLNPERSLYADASFDYHSNKMNIFLNVYNNYIHNYIYLSQLDQNEVVDGNPVYHYQQDNANLYGMEAGLTLHPVSLIHFENSFSLTRAKNKSTGNDLPFTPTPVLRNELRIEPSLNNLPNTWISIGLDNVFKQNRVDPFETTSSAYTLVNASLGTTVKLASQELQFHLSVNNMLDKAYIDHLSRFKTAGFLNPGRNISFGIFVPLSLRDRDQN